MKRSEKLPVTKSRWTEQARRSKHFAADLIYRNVWFTNCFNPVWEVPPICCAIGIDVVWATVGSKT
jgi:hypothetical protein